MGVRGRTIFKLRHRKLQQLPKNKIYSTNVRHIYFDLDDTLIHSQEKYNTAKTKCLDILQKELDLTTEERREMRMHFNAVDARRLIEQKKFNIRRFTYSWLEVYNEYCDKKGVAPKPETRALLRQTSGQAWEPPFDLYDGVLDTLKSLKTEFPISRISILTLGDPTVQEKKIKSLPKEIRNYIDGVYVVNDKDPESFKKILGDNKPEKCLMVGNSPKSDIDPALRIGMKALHIPQRTWHGDKAHINKNHENYHTVACFPEIKECIQEL